MNSMEAERNREEALNRWRETEMKKEREKDTAYEWRDKKGDVN